MIVNPGADLHELPDHRRHQAARPAFCEVPVTNDMLKTIADLPGSIGYSEYSDTAKASGVQTVTIEGRKAAREQVLDHTYPFWSVTGKDVLRSYGNTPCRELPNPTACTP
ncbi:hypothetical protein JMUB6875_73730 [Nocardia sp. JMUB6875]|uniref:hypothetical protein n=1 Tax=Nocardia sp. JMUB6875 TaxID=3158170 RepID=UPI0032E7A55F